MNQSISVFILQAGCHPQAIDQYQFLFHELLIEMVMDANCALFEAQFLGFYVLRNTS